MGGNRKLKARSQVMNCRTLIALSAGGVCGLALWMSLDSAKVSAQSNESNDIHNSLQPVPAWDSSVQFEFRDNQGPARGGFRREPSACAVARLKAPDSDRAATNPSKYRN